MNILSAIAPNISFPKTVIWICFCAAALFRPIGVAAQNDLTKSLVRHSGPTLLQYSELVTLSENDNIDEALNSKLQALLTTPFINNEAFLRGERPKRPNLSGIGPSLRLVMWNIERGTELDKILLLLTNEKEFMRQVIESHASETDKKLSEAFLRRLKKDIEILRSADVIVLNEVDWGLKRSDYKAVSSELAGALKMNWAYGVEFVEVDPKVLGKQSFEEEKDPAKRKKLEELFSVEPQKVRALHGSAILSRYAIKNVSLVPFKYQAYNWYEGEKGYGAVESGKRATASVALGEKLVREIRRGGRTNLIATLDIPDLREKEITVVATHLENRAAPKARVKQVEELLDMLGTIRHPVVIAGDMNTTGADGSVSSLKSVAIKKATDPAAWAMRGIKYASGVGVAADIARLGFTQSKFQSDPTASGVPLLAPNPEKELFETLESFRFEDGTRLDFRGDQQYSVSGRRGTLGNSNERGGKGFVTTFSMPRTLGVKGKFKLDWIFVKSHLQEESNSADSYIFAPVFARTLSEVNEALPEPLSDHAPIAVDLPLKSLPVPQRQ